MIVGVLVLNFFFLLSSVFGVVALLFQTRWRHLAEILGFT